MKIIKRIEIILLIGLLIISAIYPLLYSNEIINDIFSFIGLQ